MTSKTAPPLILIVDGDSALRERLAAQLAGARYGVSLAGDGYDALAQFDALGPAALLLDIDLPELDGFGLLTVLRDTGRIRATPVMVLTARSRPEDVRRAVDLGARDYLAKPFTEAQLLARIKRLLGGGRVAQPTARRAPARPRAPSPGKP